MNTDLSKTLKRSASLLISFLLILSLLPAAAFAEGETGEAYAELKVTKSADPASGVKAGDRVTYTVTVKTPATYG
ncbi:MAG: hypothetical protein IJM17_06140 [Firmicutes bacterium]|nr:hypothetical protein [Bacillota bacterium]